MGSGHKTLLYGNAILLRHSNSNMVKNNLITLFPYNLFQKPLKFLLSTWPACPAAPAPTSWPSTWVFKSNQKAKKIAQFLTKMKHVFNTGEACWWTVHPSSKQRSEGEKVRVGDDAILVSVATERYLVHETHYCIPKKKFAIEHSIPGEKSTHFKFPPKCH